MREDGQAVGQRFAGTGLGDPDEVAFRVRRRKGRLVKVNRLGRRVDLERALLNLGGGGKVGFGECTVERVRERQVRPCGQLARDCREGSLASAQIRSLPAFRKQHVPSKSATCGASSCAFAFAAFVAFAFFSFFGRSEVADFAALGEIAEVAVSDAVTTADSSSGGNSRTSSSLKAGSSPSSASPPATSVTGCQSSSSASSIALSLPFLLLFLAFEATSVVAVPGASSRTCQY